MNIAQIKRQISEKTGKPLESLMMVRQFEQDAPEVPTPWLSHWDNDHRIRVTMHEEVFNKIKADPQITGLAVKHEIVPEIVGENGRAAYQRFVVITPRNIEATF